MGTQTSKYDNQRGKLSPSGFDRMMTNGRAKGTIGRTATEYANQIVLERLGVEIPEPWSKAIEWGNEWEEHAVAAYEAKTGRMVIPTGRIEHPDVPYVAGTPDGLIGDAGIVEIKCPYNPMNHLGNLRENQQLADYMYQIQGYLWITGRHWCDFVSFDPRFNDGLKLHIHTVERDGEIIKAIAARAALIESLVVDVLKGLDG
jgi:predicted phage-related endonuclease